MNATSTVGKQPRPISFKNEKEDIGKVKAIQRTTKYEL